MREEGATSSPGHKRYEERGCCNNLRGSGNLQFWPYQVDHSLRKLDLASSQDESGSSSSSS